jgi:hypothetical protein
MKVARTSDGALDCKLARRTLQVLHEQIKRCYDWQIPLQVVSQLEIRAFFQEKGLLPEHQSAVDVQAPRAGASVMVESVEQDCMKPFLRRFDQTIVLIPWVTVSTNKSDQDSSQIASFSSPALIAPKKQLSDASMVRAIQITFSRASVCHDPSSCDVVRQDILADSQQGLDAERSASEQDAYVLTTDTLQEKLFTLVGHLLHAIKSDHDQHRINDEDKHYLKEAVKKVLHCLRTSQELPPMVAYHHVLAKLGASHRSTFCEFVAAASQFRADLITSHPVPQYLFQCLLKMD